MHLTNFSSEYRRGLCSAKWLAILVAVLVAPLAFGQSISLAGVAPNQVSFGTQTVATISQPQLIVLSNAGDAPLHITKLALKGEFAYRHDCPGELEPGAECRIWVAFKPSAVGPRTGQLAITNDAGIQKVALSGTATTAVPASMAQK
jgi:hypothetical protein